VVRAASPAVVGWRPTRSRDSIAQCATRSTRSLPPREYQRRSRDRWSLQTTLHVYLEPSVTQGTQAIQPTNQTSRHRVLSCSYRTPVLDSKPRSNRPATRTSKDWRLPDRVRAICTPITTRRTSPQSCLRTRREPWVRPLPSSSLSSLLLLSWWLSVSVSCMSSDSGCWPRIIHAPYDRGHEQYASSRWTICHPSDRDRWHHGTQAIIITRTPTHPCPHPHTHTASLLNQTMMPRWCRAIDRSNRLLDRSINGIVIHTINQCGPDRRTNEQAHLDISERQAVLGTSLLKVRLESARVLVPTRRALQAGTLQRWIRPSHYRSGSPTFNNEPSMRATRRGTTTISFRTREATQRQ